MSSTDIISRLKAAVNKGEISADLQNQIVRGDEMTTVTLPDGTTIPSLQKLIADVSRIAQDSYPNVKSAYDQCVTLAATAQTNAENALQYAELAEGYANTAVAGGVQHTQLFTAGIAYVRSGGNDSTAQVGYPSRAWSTLEAAWAANGSNVVYSVAGDVASATLNVTGKTSFTIVNTDNNFTTVTLATDEDAAVGDFTITGLNARNIFIDGLSIGVLTLNKCTGYIIKATRDASVDPLTGQLDPPSEDNTTPLNGLVLDECFFEMVELQYLKLNGAANFTLQVLDSTVRTEFAMVFDNTDSAVALTGTIVNVSTSKVIVPVNSNNTITRHDERVRT
jgi:hypothetical protein